MENLDYSLIFKALGDRSRLQIVEMLSSGEKCACKLLEEFDITQPTLSHHMKILCQSGLVDVRKDGKWCHYSLNPEAILEVKKFINSIECCRDGE